MSKTPLLERPDVLTLQDIDIEPLSRLLVTWALELVVVEAGQPIPFSYWGAPDAGISGHRVFARADTPVHSILHEASHLAVMEAERRNQTERDAGGDDLEECAVCYLQLVSASRLEDVGLDRLARDMDRWGYSFRLGSTLSWFHHDTQNARDWLRRAGLLPSGEGFPPALDMPLRSA